MMQKNKSKNQKLRKNKRKIIREIKKRNEVGIRHFRTLTNRLCPVASSFRFQLYTILTQLSIKLHLRHPRIV